MERTTRCAGDLSGGITLYIAQLVPQQTRVASTGTNLELRSGAHGRQSVEDGEKFVRGGVGRLTRKHDATEPKPWKMGDCAPEYIDGMLKAIVGIEIAMTPLEGKSKLSQSREVRDRLNAAEVLAKQGETELAQAHSNDCLAILATRLSTILR